MAPPPPGQHYGTGLFTFPDGSTFTGGWTALGPAGEKSRHGEGSYVNGPESYEGSWKDDFMEGKGSQKFASGASYDGIFAAGKYEGEGSYAFPDGAGYEGNWREGRMHGLGVYTDGEGVVFKGQFFNGSFNNGRAFVNLR